MAKPQRRKPLSENGCLSLWNAIVSGPVPEKKSAFQKMLPSLAKTDLACILLRSGRERGCGLSSLQRPRTSSGLGRSTDSELPGRTNFKS